MTPTEAYKAGKLTEAITAALEQVRAAPTDRGKRLFLAELCCFSGDLERADKQLDVLFTPDAPDVIQLTLFRQLVRGELARREVFARGRMPEFLAQPSDALKLRLEALIRLREDKKAEAAELFAKAEEQRPAASGTCDGAAFDDFRDLDDVVAPVLEVITANGNYYWVPMETIELLEFHKPERTRDLYWRPAHLDREGRPGRRGVRPGTLFRLAHRGRRRGEARSPHRLARWRNGAVSRVGSARVPDGR